LYPFKISVSNSKQNKKAEEVTEGEDIFRTDSVDSRTINQEWFVAESKVVIYIGCLEKHVNWPLK
jgi:hypothetical protein